MRTTYLTIKRRVALSEIQNHVQYKRLRRCTKSTRNEDAGASLLRAAAGVAGGPRGPLRPAPSARARGEAAALATISGRKPGAQPERGRPLLLTCSPDPPPMF